MSESQQQQHQQQYLQQQHPPQQPLSPVQPANVYTPPAHSPEAIQTIPQGQASHQVLPPSYDQAKLPPRGVAAPRLPATMVPLNMLSDRPEPIDCPYCHRRTMTEVRKEGSSMQILVGVLLCLICPCLACVPCCAHWFEDAEYRCNQCNNMVARRRHDGPLEVSAPPVAVYSQYGQQPQMHAQPQQYEMHPQQPQLQQQQQQQQYNHQQQQQQQHQHAQPGTPQPQQKQ